MGFHEAEWENIVTDGEFSTGRNNIVVSILHNSISYPVSCMESKSWKRKEVDGQLLADLPQVTRVVIIPASQIPSIIAKSDSNNLRFVIDGEGYDTLFHVGTDQLTFMLRTGSEVVENDDDDVPVDGDGDETPVDDDEVPLG